MKDEMQKVFIDPNFYSALKEYGCSTARFASGKYKEELAQAMWVAYLCGKEGQHAQALSARFPDDETQPHEK